MGKQIYIPEIKAYLPDKLKEDLDILIDDVVDSEMDMVIVIDGKEGSGKSYDARLIGKYISSVVKTPFSVPNIHFSTDEYINFSEKHPIYTINVLDESRQALNKRRGMSRSNVNFTNWLSENRDKQQIHILLLPAIHDLDSYVSIWRMKLLVRKLLGHVKNKKTRSGYSMVRGYLRVYDNDKMLQQVIFNKNKYGYYAYPKEFKYQRKIKHIEVFTEKEIKDYKKKKAEARKKKYQDNVSYKREDKLLYIMHTQMGMKQTEIAKKINLPQSAISAKISNYQKLSQDEDNT